MFFISHRGNLNGPDARYENSIEYINHALESGFHVEVDVHYYKNNFYLGHDEPAFLTSLEFLENKKLWCHAKSMDTMGAFYKTKCHYFWHETDAVTITNQGYYWTYQEINYLKIAFVFCQRDQIIKIFFVKAFVQIIY